MKRIVVTLSMIIIAILSITLSVFASHFNSPVPLGDVPGKYYSSELTLTVPGFNFSASTLPADDFVIKCTNENLCTFQAIAFSTDAGADARLLNSNNQPRSSWARDLSIDSVKTANTTATRGYFYYAQISSDLLQLQSFDITFKFSPDDMTDS